MKNKTFKKRGRSTKKIVEATEWKPPTSEVAVVPDKDEDAWDNDGLTIRQRSFVEALVGPAGGSITRAAEMAGYNANNRRVCRATACNLMNRPNVQEAVARAFARRRLTPEWAQDRLAEIASSSMRNFGSVVDGVFEIDWEKAADHGAIGQIREVNEKVLRTEGKIQLVERKIKLHDPTPAIQTILKLSGLLKEEKTIRLTGADGGPVKTETAHSFDHDAYRELFRQQRSGHINGRGVVEANGN